MKKPYEKLKIEVIRFAENDVIVASSQSYTNDADQDYENVGDPNYGNSGTGTNNIKNLFPF